MSVVKVVSFRAPSTFKGRGGVFFYNGSIITRCESSRGSSAAAGPLIVLIVSGAIRSPADSRHLQWDADFYRQIKVRRRLLDLQQQAFSASDIRQQLPPVTHLMVIASSPYSVIVSMLAPTNPALFHGHCPRNAGVAVFRVPTV